jgi:hypothetical protein
MHASAVLVARLKRRDSSIHYPPFGRRWFVRRVEDDQRSRERHHKFSHGNRPTPRDRSRTTATIGASRTRRTMHYMFDLTLDEDAHRAKSGFGPQLTALARNTGTAICRRCGMMNIAEFRREFAGNLQRLFSLPGFVKNATTLATASRTNPVYTFSETCYVPPAHDFDDISGPFRSFSPRCLNFT